MDSFSLIMISVTCFLGLSSVWLLVSFLSLNKKNIKLNRKLTVTESDFVRTKELLSQSEKKWAKNQEQQNNISIHQNEFLELRRENSKYKDDLKKSKEDLRIKDGELKRLESVHIDKLYLLTNEKEALLSQLREIDKTSRTQLQEANQQLSELAHQDLSLQEKNAVLEKQIKANISKIITFQAKLKFAEQEIAKLNKELNIPKVEIIPPEELLRWKERALCAKKMYQLMRQMRELSDNKVETYQDGIIAISEWVLTHTNHQVPTIKENENKADRFLAEAWTAVIAGSYIAPPMNNYEQSINV